MRIRTLLTGLLLAAATQTQAQTTPPAPSEELVYSYAEQMPQPPGGLVAFMQAVKEQVQYPAAAAKQQIEGRVFVQFVVNREGRLERPKVLKGLHPLLDAEAVRVILAMPAWTPGRQNGQAVNVFYTLPVPFELPTASRATPPTPAALPAPADRIYTYVEQMPVPKGGMQELQQFITQNLSYPAEARKQRLGGQVLVRYVVDAQGRVTQPVVAKGVHPLLDAEAVRVIAAMPAWEPGRQNGRPVSVLLTTPVTFTP